MEIDAGLVPLSAAAREARRLEVCLTGGDDYELLLACPEESATRLQEECARAGLAVTRIGRFVDGPAEVRVFDGSRMMALPGLGWSHF